MKSKSSRALTFKNCRTQQNDYRNAGGGLNSPIVLCYTRLRRVETGASASPIRLNRFISYRTVKKRKASTILPQPEATATDQAPKAAALFLSLAASRTVGSVRLEHSNAISG